MDQNQIKEILGKYKVIAVVGLSNDPEKVSFKVSSYMQRKGYRIIPVNPFVDEILGERSYRSLLDVPVEIQRVLEVVNVFRKAEDVPPIVEQVVELKMRVGRPFVVWMQLGIVNDAAAESLRRSGLVVVMDKCLMIEHQHLS